MSISKTLIASVFIALFIVHLLPESDATTESASNLLTKIDCPSACNRRCRLSSRQNMCKRACGTCCFRCNCVPSGTNDHYDECPCYANITTHGGRHKCP